MALTGAPLVMLVRLAAGFKPGEPPAIILVIPPIIVSAYLGGLGPGLLATAIAAVGEDLLFIQPIGSLTISTGLGLVQWIGLIVTGLLISVLNDRLHRSQQRTEISDRRLAVTLASLGDAVITTDRSGRVTSLNPEAERLTGWTHAEGIGERLPVVFRVVHENSGQPAEDPAAHILRTGLALALANHTALIHRDGGRVPIEQKGAPIKREDGAIEGAVLVFRDCTGQRRIQEALRDRMVLQERFSQIAENIREVFWLTDPAKRQMIYVSPAYEKIWGRSCESLYASPGDWVNAIHPDDRAKVEAALPSQVTGEYDQEFRIIAPDGATRWIRDRAFPVHGPDGEVIRVTGVAEDVTERRQLEAQLRQAQKMESIGQLAGGVAHDFNNILTVIMGSAELLTETLSDHPAAMASVNEIAHAADRAASLTRQLLAFSRKEVIEPRVIDLNELVADTGKMLRRLLGEDIQLTTRLRGTSSPVKIDPGQWTQVLMNLAVNARDAMPSGGRLTVETDMIDLTQADMKSESPLRPGRHVILRIADTGCGMGPDVLAHVFEPFFTTKGVGRGTGLGLAVVYGIVKQSGGFIEMKSEIDRGTRFTIYLPDVQMSEMPRAVLRVDSGVTGDETLLIVEDEPSLRRIAARGLRAGGYTVLEAGNGEEALRALRSHASPIDLIVTDVVMPGMDGRTLADKIRVRRPNVKLLFTSGYTEDAVLHHRVEQETMAFLQKPYTPHTLLAKVRRVLDDVMPVQD